jgi:hypothetical protein
MSETELLPKPKREPELVRRLEVFTGAGRRRRWTAEQKARIVAEKISIATLIFRYFLRYFSSTHRADLSRFRGTFHSFDPVGFAIFATSSNPQLWSTGVGDLIRYIESSTKEEKLEQTG